MNARLVDIACVLAITTIPTATWAQTDQSAVQNDQSEDQLHEIVVTAARGQGTRDARRVNLQTVDAIGPVDIDSLPSQNVADVLKRLAGVQLTYDNGEAQQPNIRGVQYIQTTVDGRETATANTRALQIGDVPGDVVSSVEVFKSPSADMIEGGIGGLVALKTKQPLDYTKTSINGQLSGSRDEKRGDWEPQGSIGGGGSWDTSLGRIGFSAGFAHTAVKLRSDFFISNYATSTQEFDLNNNGQVGDAADNAIYPSLGLPIEINAKHSRDSGIANFQWAPNDELDLHAAVFHAEYLDESQQYSLLGIPAAANSAADYGAFSLVPDSPVGVPVVRSGSFANANLTSQSLWVRPNRKVTQESLGASWTREDWTVSAEADFTQSRNDNDILIFAANMTVPQLLYRGAQSPHRGSISAVGADITNPTGFAGMNYTEILPRADSDGNSQRIDLNYRHDGWLSGLQVGVRRSGRTSTADQAFASTPITGTLASVGGLAALSPDGDFVVANPLLFENKVDFRRMVGLPQALPANSPGSHFELEETSYAGYVRALYGFQVGGVDIDGDIGVRVIDSKNTGRAFQVGPSGDIPITRDGKTTDWLPSATLRARLTDSITLRLTGSKTMSRPLFTQLSPGVTLNANQTGSGGNPNLESFYATGVDAGIDWFFSQSGYATFAVFTKTLKGLITNVVTQETINGLPYQISRPINGDDDASYDGFEVNANYKFVELPGLLSGIGVDANYTYLKSKMTNAAGQKTDIPGLAKNTTNMSIYYDRGPLLVRVGYAITSSFVNNPNFGGVPELGGQELFGRQDVMDATVQYRFTDHFRLTANVLNALQPDVGYYNGFLQTPNNSYITYRRYQLGVKFNF